MRENRQSGSEGGGTENNRFSLPLSKNQNKNPTIPNPEGVVPLAQGIALGSKPGCFQSQAAKPKPPPASPPCAPRVFAVNGLSPVRNNRPVAPATGSPKPKPIAPF